MKYLEIKCFDRFLKLNSCYEITKDFSSHLFNRFWMQQKWKLTQSGRNGIAVNKTADLEARQASSLAN
jgi:hypothetical protein